MVAVDAPTQLFLSLASPRSLRPLPPGWGDGAEVEVVGRRWVLAAHWHWGRLLSCGGPQHQAGASRGHPLVGLPSAPAFCLPPAAAECTLNAPTTVHTLRHPRTYPCHRISGSGLSWEFRADSLSVVKAAPPRRVFGGGGGGGGDISASAAAKPGLRVLYLRARFPRDCALAPGSARQTKATVQVQSAGLAGRHCRCRPRPPPPPLPPPHQRAQDSQPSHRRNQAHWHTLAPAPPCRRALPAAAPRAGRQEHRAQRLGHAVRLLLWPHLAERRGAGGDAAAAHDVRRGSHGSVSGAPPSPAVCGWSRGRVGVLLVAVRVAAAPLAARCRQQAAEPRSSGTPTTSSAASRTKPLQPYRAVPGCTLTAHAPLPPTLSCPVLSSLPCHPCPAAAPCQPCWAGPTS